MPLKYDDIVSLGEKAAVIKANYVKDEYGGETFDYKLVDLNGKPIIDKNFKESGYFTKEGYIYLGESVRTENGSFGNLDVLKYNLYDSTGKIVIKDCAGYNDGTYLEAKNVGFNEFIPLYHYKLKDYKTGKEYFSLNQKDIKEVDYIYRTKATVLGSSEFGNYGTFMFYDTGCMAAAANSYPDFHIVASTKYGNIDLYKKAKEFDNSLSDFYGCSMSGSGVATVLYDGFSAVIDIVNNTFSKCDTRVQTLQYIRDYNIAIVQKRAAVYGNPSTYSITDMGMKTTYLDNLSMAAECRSKKYLLISDGKRWGYFDLKTHKDIWFDDATEFYNGYAFVINGGKGHFVDENLNPVSDDIPASGASLTSGILRIDNKLYRVNFPQ